MKTLDKTISVIKSCKTHEQLRSAMKWSKSISKKEDKDQIREATVSAYNNLN